MNFAKFLRTPFLTEHRRWLLLEKRQSKLLCHKNNVCCQNLNENIKRYLICSTRALDLLTMPGKSVYANLQDVWVAL